MRGLPDRVAATISRYNMLRRGARAGVAVSGGADSVCLLHILAAMAGDWELSLHVLHLNHALRGAESDADARFVEELAASLGLPCLVARREVALLGGNLEQAAREARLEFFQAARESLGLEAIATGHTLSDQAETLLFRILRGTGLAGLAGILPVTSEGLIRPLLEVERVEVEQWLRDRGFPWCEDSSNLDLSFARNRLRHEVLPALESVLGGSPRSALARLASVAGLEEDFWRKLVDDEFSKARIDGPVVILDTRHVAGLHPALGRRLMRRALEHTAGSLRGFTLDHADAALALAASREGSGSAALPGVEVRRSFNWLRFAPPGTRATGWSVQLDAPGRAAPPCRLEVLEAERLYNERRDRLDAARVRFPLILRSWRPGDAYQPAGERKAKPLKELFQEARVPCWDRPDWPIIVSEGRIAWSRRFGAAAWAAATETSGKVWLVVERA